MYLLTTASQLSLAQNKMTMRGIICASLFFWPLTLHYLGKLCVQADRPKAGEGKATRILTKTNFNIVSSGGFPNLSSFSCRIFCSVNSRAVCSCSLSFPSGWEMEQSQIIYTPTNHHLIKNIRNFFGKT